MNKDDMKHRTRQFALRVIRLVESLPKGRTEDVLGKQLLRSGTVGWIKVDRPNPPIIDKCVMVKNLAWKKGGFASLNPPYTAPG
jgi:hypothetical protein